MTDEERAQVRREAFEEAAKVCEQRWEIVDTILRKRRHLTAAMCFWRREPTECAALIRKLI